MILKNVEIAVSVKTKKIRDTKFGIPDFLIRLID